MTAVPSWARDRSKHPRRCQGATLALQSPTLTLRQKCIGQRQQAESHPSSSSGAQHTGFQTLSEVSHHVTCNWMRPGGRQATRNAAACWFCSSKVQKYKDPGAAFCPPQPPEIVLYNLSGVTPALLLDNQGEMRTELCVSSRTGVTCAHGRRGPEVMNWQLTRSSTAILQVLNRQSSPNLGV
jgi:hypothetical protein